MNYPKKLLSVITLIMCLLSILLATETESLDPDEFLTDWDIFRQGAAFISMTDKMLEMRPKMKRIILDDEPHYTVTDVYRYCLASFGSILPLEDFKSLSKEKMNWDFINSHTQGECLVDKEELANLAHRNPLPPECHAEIYRSMQAQVDAFWDKYSSWHQYFIEEKSQGDL